MSWAIKRVEGGHVLTWDGKEWGMEPQDRPWVVEYLARLKERYPEGGAWLVAGTSSSRHRGGPWRWTMSDGESEVIHLGRLEDAKAMLRRQLRRKTLPAGTTWNLEE